MIDQNDYSLCFLVLKMCARFALLWQSIAISSNISGEAASWNTLDIHSPQHKYELHP